VKERCDIQTQKEETETTPQKKSKRQKRLILEKKHCDITKKRKGQKEPTTRTT